MASGSGRLLLHAPNVHSGGGLTLLHALAAVNAPEPSFDWAQLDQRLLGHAMPLVGCVQHHVDRSLWSRLVAEWRLRRISRSNDVVLCFHSLPPLFRLPARCVVFVQNRLLLERSLPAGFSAIVRARLRVERWWLHACSSHAQCYLVQTPSMAHSLKALLGENADIRVRPFLPAIDVAAQHTALDYAPRYDFLYVASGDPHKNHLCLLQAWRVLADTGQYPSLALTVDPRCYPDLNAQMLRYIAKYKLAISNLGRLSITDVNRLYPQCRALIYPSLSESFGLPLLEAQRHGVAILASELDYVRDVVEPVQSFDPHSPLSIARAVRRFMGYPEHTYPSMSAGDFLDEVRT